MAPKADIWLQIKYIFDISEATTTWHAAPLLHEAHTHPHTIIVIVATDIVCYRFKDNNFNVSDCGESEGS